MHGLLSTPCISRLFGFVKRTWEWSKFSGIKVNWGLMKNNDCFFACLTVTIGNNELVAMVGWDGGVLSVLGDD